MELQTHTWTTLLASEEIAAASETISLSLIAASPRLTAVGRLQMRKKHMSYGLKANGNEQKHFNNIANKKFLCKNTDK